MPSHISPTTVPSATNISLDCHNFINILRWDYSDHETLKPNFEVTVKKLERWVV